MANIHQLSAAMSCQHVKNSHHAFGLDLCRAVACWQRIQSMPSSSVAEHFGSNMPIGQRVQCMLKRPLLDHTMESSHC